MIYAGDFKCPCDACKALGDQAAGILGALAYALNQMEARVANALNTPAYKLTITSGRRCPAHNAAIGGAPDSQHLTGLAADLLADDSQAHYALVSAAVAVNVPFIEVCPRHIHVDLRAGPKRLILGAG